MNAFSLRKVFPVYSIVVLLSERVLTIRSAKIVALQVASFLSLLISPVWALSAQSNRHETTPAHSILSAIDVADARKLAGPHDVIVAVIDTGIDLQNPALTPHLWINPGETGKDSEGRDKATNNFDDDGNGLVDDVHGFNFANHNANVKDSHGHGTHIADLIRRLAPNAKLMILKYYETGKTLENVDATVKAIEYATKMGARIINYSGGGRSPYPAERKALEEALKKNILVVAAAGNEASSNDVKKFYPASYDLPNILSIASVTFDLSLVPSSNYGANSVHLAAPGLNIEAAVPGGRTQTMTGTSQATAVVTGVAALLHSQNPDLPFESSRKRLIHFAKKSKYLSGKIKSAASVSAFRALANRDSANNAFDGVDRNYKVNEAKFLYP